MPLQCLQELEYVDTGLGLRDAAEEPDFGGVGDSWGSLGVGGGIGDGLDEIEELDDI